MLASLEQGKQFYCELPWEAILHRGRKFIIRLGLSSCKLKLTRLLLLVPRAVVWVKRTGDRVADVVFTICLVVVKSIFDMRWEDVLIALLMVRVNDLEGSPLSLSVAAFGRWGAGCLVISRCFHIAEMILTIMLVVVEGKFDFGRHVIPTKVVVRDNDFKGADLRRGFAAGAARVLELAMRVVVSTF